MKITSTFTQARVLAATSAIALSLMLTSPAFADTLTRQLQTGMSGDDVTSLQTFLAQDSVIYPQGRVTGYFGFLTKAAVSNFQVANGLPAVGRVGPLTLALINQQMGGTASASENAPVISNVTLTTATSSAAVHWTTDKPAIGIVYYSTTQLTINEKGRDEEISGTSAIANTVLNLTQDVTLPNLQPNTTYYYVVYTKDVSGNVQTTWPSNFTTQK